MTPPITDWQQQLALLAGMPEGICVTDAQGRLLGGNEAFRRMAGFPADDPASPIGHSLAALAPQDEAPMPMATDSYRTRWLRPDGSRINVQISASRNADGTTTCWVHDITDLIATTHALRRGQAFFEFLIAANALIARAEDAAPFLTELCALATRLDPRIALAWVGLLQADGQVTVAAKAGRAQTYLDGIAVCVDPARPEGQGPTGRALREQRLIVAENFGRDPATAPWRERALRHGIITSAALPFRRGGRPVGALMLYGSEEGIFDGDFRRLLEEFGTSLSLAMDYFAEREDAHQMADALQQSERQYRLLADNIRDVIWLYDLELQRFLYVSRSNERLTGYTAAEAMQLTVAAIATPASNALIAEWIARDLDAWRRGDYRPRTEEIELRCKDGGTVWAEMTTQLATDPVTGHLQVYGVSRDISSRRAAERRFREVVELATEGIGMIDAKGVFVLVNRRLHDMLGEPDGGLLGRAMIDLLSPEDRDRFAKRFHEVATGRLRETRNARYSLRHRDGRRLVVLLSASHRYDEQDRYMGSVGMITDITQIVAAEQALRDALHTVETNLERQKELNQKLEEAHNQLLQSEKMASIGQLAAGVAHELNNPIGFVYSNLGSLDSYLKDIFEIADAYEQAEITMGDSCPALDGIRALKKAKDYDYLRQDITQLMSESRDGLDRVRKIVQDLKDFSRVGDMNWQWADLHQGIESTLNVVWNELKYKCTVTRHFDEHLPRIRCLPSQLNQVFMNLLVNAAQAMEPKDGKLGEITITTRSLDPDSVQIEIRDTGAGIPPEQLERIFDPFFTTKPVGKGTGLGLSIAWGIVGRHHGHIEVASTVGVGTTFTITLPVDGGQDETAPPTPSAAPAS